MQTKSGALAAGKKVLEMCLYAGLGLAFASGMAFLFMVGVLAWLGQLAGVLVDFAAKLKNQVAHLRRASGQRKIQPSQSLGSD